MKSMISARHLSKHYGDLLALSDVSFDVKPGSIVGLIGPNGAGKTTLLKAVFGLTTYQGSLNINGLSPRRQHVALMNQMCFIADVATLPSWMSVAQAIDFVAGVHPKFNRSKAKELLAKTGIHDQQRVRQLSKGMVVQLHLALVMAIDVDLLILDEPTLGLDIIHRKQFYNSLLNDYYDEQKTIVITTHQVEEVENLLTDLLVIDRGEIKLDISIDDYQQRFSQIIVPNCEDQRLESLKPIYQCKHLMGTQLIYCDVDREQLSQVAAVTVPSISDVFLATVSSEELS